MTILEKVAYIKGLSAGLNLNSEKSETKLFTAILDLLEEMAIEMEDIADTVDIINEELEEVDEDLDSLEEYVYDDCDCDEFFEIECPSCGEIVSVDEDILEGGSIECPSCGELLEFDIEVEELEDDS